MASHVVHHLMAEKVFDDLKAEVPWREIATRRGYRPELFQATLDFLVIEGLLERSERDGGVAYSVTGWYERKSEARGYLSLLVGGYSPVFQRLPQVLRGERAERDGRWVGLASCQIAKLDTIPMTREIVRDHHPDCRRIVDFGCGNAQYLVALCQLIDGVHAIGIEPDRQAYEAGVETVRRASLEDRIELVNCGAMEYEPQAQPDFMLFGFVLQELVGQSGEAETVEFLRNVGGKYRGTKLVVFEIHYGPDDRDVMRSEIGLGFYNGYYLLHPLTEQKLLPCRAWEDLFERANFSIVERRKVDPEVDPSGLVVAYVLAYRS